MTPTELDPLRGALFTRSFPPFPRRSPAELVPGRSILPRLQTAVTPSLSVAVYPQCPEETYSLFPVPQGFPKHVPRRSDGPIFTKYDQNCARTNASKGVVCQCCTISYLIRC